MRSYAIGDIHGQLSLLQAAHDRITRDIALHGPAPILHLGDLIDRGPDSRGVIDYLMQGIAAGEDWLVLKGNHDRLFSRFMADPWWQDPGLRLPLNWLHWKVGGAETLQSYGVKHAADRPIEKVHAEAQHLVPQAHLDFLDSCPTLLQRGEVVFVHAGLRPEVALDAQKEDDLVWIREPFLSHAASFGPLVVHGHTAIDAPLHYGNRVNIDSSAGYGGPVTAIVLEGREVYHLTEAGRVALRPAVG